MRIEISTERRALARPFRVSHTSVSHIEIVSLVLGDGPFVGTGEVALGPWSAETVDVAVDTARRLLSQLPDESYQLRDVLDLMHSARSAACAARLLVEMALLDRYARLERAPLWEVLGLRPPPALIPLLETVPLGESARPRKKGRLKVKLGGPRDRDVIAQLAEAEGSVLVDVNRGWRSSTCEEMIPLLKALPLLALEDPTSDAHALPRVKELLGATPLILDEGVSTVEDTAAALSIADGVNLKLLKTGGLLEARAALARIEDAGKMAMLGCYIETPRAIAYAAQLAGHVDILDLDGHAWLSAHTSSSLAIDIVQPGAARYIQPEPPEAAPGIVENPNGV